MSTPSVASRTEAFLKTGDQFRLGSLVTETPNVSTRELSQLCQSDLPRAAELFRNVELDALETLQDVDSLAQNVVDSFEQCLRAGRRIFLCGCGATGRLSLILESVWRQAPRAGFENSVVAFTAGGDYALVRSLGVFEDRPDLGAKHLMDLGFQDGDVLVAITEGGETPFVLGALDQATKTSAVDSWLLFCNPPELLQNLVARSRNAMENPRVRWHGFETPPMALTGSTRLQASTVLMAFVGACLREVAGGQRFRWIISELVDGIVQMNAKDFVPLIEIECDAHQRNEFTLHRSRSAAMPVLTDTTERSPTFSLTPFESKLDSNRSDTTSARTYLEIPRTKNSSEAWRHLLRREPRPFHAPKDVNAPNIDLNAITAFDFSDGVRERRKEYGVQTTTILDVEFGEDLHLSEEPTLYFRNENDRAFAEVRLRSSHEPLIRQAQMKYALNLQSTLAMGRLGRFHGNLMTFVRPTNGKLVDRALRTLRQLAFDEAVKTGSAKLDRLARGINDEPFLNAIFEAVDSVSPDEPVALRALEILRR